MKNKYIPLGVGTLGGQEDSHYVPVE